MPTSYLMRCVCCTGVGGLAECRRDREITLGSGSTGMHVAVEVVERPVRAFLGRRAFELADWWRHLDLSTCAGHREVMIVVRRRTPERRRCHQRERHARGQYSRAELP